MYYEYNLCACRNSHLNLWFFVGLHNVVHTKRPRDCCACDIIDVNITSHHTFNRRDTQCIRDNTLKIDTLGYMSVLQR